MGQCNWCRVADIRYKARRQQMKVTVLASGTKGGSDVFVHPKGEKPLEGFAHVPDSKEGFDRYWRMWAMRIGERCEC